MLDVIKTWNLLYAGHDKTSHNKLIPFFNKYFRQAELAQTASAAKEYLSGNPDATQLIIAEEKLPESGGLAFAKEVKLEYPRIKIIILSAEINEQFMSDAINVSGVDGVLGKPLRPPELTAILQRLVETSQKEQEDLARQCAALFTLPAAKPSEVGTPETDACESVDGAEPGNTFSFEDAEDVDEDFDPMGEAADLGLIEAEERPAEPEEEPSVPRNTEDEAEAEDSDSYDTSYDFDSEFDDMPDMEEDEDPFDEEEQPGNSHHDRVLEEEQEKKETSESLELSEHDSWRLERIMAGEEPLPLTVPEEKCIATVFGPYKTFIDEHESLLTKPRRLKFLQMKRFLFTAHQNLIDLDAGIASGEADAPHKELLAIQHVYDEMVIILNRPVTVNYEQFFLSKQPFFKHLREKIESIKTEMTVLKSESNKLAETLKKIKAKLEKIKDKRSEPYLEVQRDYHSINAQYVDRIHQTQQRREEVENAITVQDTFYNEHLSIFKDIFQKKKEAYKQDYESIMDVMAYDFDRILWKDARLSQKVKTFFETSKIQGSFSSRTYLKYFLKHLDEEKMSEENQKLVALLNSMENLYKRNFLILGDDPAFLNVCKEVIPAIDDLFTIQAAMNPVKVIKDYQMKPFDICIVDYEIKAMDGMSFIKKFRKIYPDQSDEIVFCLRFRKPSKELFKQGLEMGVRHLIKADLNKTTVREKALDLFLEM